MLQVGQFLAGCSVEVFLGGGEPASPAQSALLAPQFLPGVGRLGQVPVHTHSFAVVLDPAAQPGPGRDQGFVGHLDHVAVQGEQPGTGQCFHHLGGVAPAGAGQFCALDGTAGVGSAVTGDDHAQQHPAGGSRLVLGEPAVDLLGGPGDRAVQASRCLVPRHGQCLAAAAAPGLQQRVGQQRQSAGFVGDLLDQPGGQSAFHGQPGGRGRLYDGVAQFRRAHRCGQEVGVAQRVGQVTVFGTAAVEVAAHRQQHAQAALGLPGCQQQIDEVSALGRVVAEGEDLLELVDDHEGVRLGVAVAGYRGCEEGRVAAGGMFARGEDPDRGRARARLLSVPEDGYQAGPQQGGLAAAGGAEDRGEPPTAQEVDQVGGELFPAEEQAAVPGLEPCQASVRRECSVLVPGVVTGEFLDRRFPPGLPFGQVSTARPRIGQDHRQCRQLLAGRRLRERGHRVARPLGQRPVGDPVRFRPQLA